METNEIAETTLSDIIAIDISSPVIMQDKPKNKRKKVENPKNVTSTTSNKTPMINRLSLIDKNSCTYIKNYQLVKGHVLAPPPQGPSTVSSEIFSGSLNFFGFWVVNLSIMDVACATIEPASLAPSGSNTMVDSLAIFSLA